MIQNDKLSFLKGFLGQCKFNHNTKEAEFFCPSCKHHKQKLAVNIDTDVYQCWVCGKKGTILSLLYDVKVPSEKISSYISVFKPKNVNKKSGIRCVQVLIGNQYVPSLPKEYQPLSTSKNSFFCKNAFAYLKSRDLPEDYILKYKLGFCSTGEYTNRIIIPSFDKEGNLNFFTGRDITGQSSIPYLNDIKNMPKGYKNTIIVNELNVDFSKTVIITEGFFDMFKSVPNTVPLCGSSFTKEGLLFNTLVQNQSDVILALDPDAFFKKTLKMASLMLSYGLNVRSADFRPFKDLGKMTKEEGTARIANARELNEVIIRRYKLKGLFKDD